MFLSFDVDAEAAWTCRDPARYRELITMSYGGYEARVGVRKLLELLDSLGLKATFFMTGWSVMAHPAMAESILAAGHEIAHHGFHHLMPDPADPAMMLEEVDRGFEALKSRLGVVPKGYRAPLGESFEELRRLLRDRGLVHSSSWRDDVRPYRPHPGRRHPRLSNCRDPELHDWIFGLSTATAPAHAAARGGAGRSGRTTLTKPATGAAWSPR